MAQVFKFGGASVKDADGFRNVVDIIQKRNDSKIVVVVSASGKMTNALEKVVHAFFNEEANPKEKLQQVVKHHQTICAELFDKDHEVHASLNDKLVEIDWVLEEDNDQPFDYIYDQIVSVGEFLSSLILSALLKKSNIENTWLDIRDIMRTDETWREAKVMWEETVPRMQNLLPLLLEKGLIVTQGFVGSTSENQSTTLGREGSDYTGAIISYAIDAECMMIWKDVPGVLTADPNLFDNPTKLDRLSYREAIEMTYYGAKVIHPKTIQPIQRKRIPLLVKSFINPEGKGTTITDAQEFEAYPPVIVIKENQTLISFSTRDFSFIAEDHLMKIFALFAEHRLSVNMMQNTAVSFSVCVDDNSKRINYLIEDLQDEFEISKKENLEVITIRHYTKEAVEKLKGNKLVLLEGRVNKTIQMAVQQSNTPDRKLKA